MAVYEDELITKWTWNIAQPINELSKFNSLGKQLGKIQGTTGDMNGEFAKIEKILGKDTAQFRQFVAGFNESIKKSKEFKTRFDMNTLSWLFGGIALQRLGTSMLRFMIPAEDQLAKINDHAAKKVLGVGAAFEFMKVSIFETLANTPLFQDFIAWIIKASIWIGEFAQKNPLVVEIAATIAGLAAILGTIAISFGLFKQFDQMGKLIKNMFGSDGKGGTAGKSMSGFQNLLNTLGVAINGVELTANIVGIIDSVKKGDAAGAIMDGIAAGLNLAAMGAFFMKKTGAGWILTLSATAIMTVEKLTADVRGKNEAMDKLKDMLGINNVKKQMNENAGIIEGPIRGVIDSMIPPSEDSVKDLVDTTVKKYEETKSKLEDINNKIEDAIKKKDSTALNGLIQQRDKLQGNMNQMYAYLSLIDQEAISKINAKDETQKLLQKTDDLGKTTYAVTQQNIDQYTAQFGEQLKNTDETNKLIANTQKFGQTVNDTFGGVKGSVGVIGQFSAFGEQIILDNQHFDALKNDINNWASTETVKTIKIRYVESNKPSGTAGFFESTGKKVDDYIGSVTGGKK